MNFMVTWNEIQPVTDKALCIKRLSLTVLKSSYKTKSDKIWELNSIRYIKNTQDTQKRRKVKSEKPETIRYTPMDS